VRAAGWAGMTPGIARRGLRCRWRCAGVRSTRGPSRSIRRATPRMRGSGSRRSPRGARWWGRSLRRSCGGGVFYEAALDAARDREWARDLLPGEGSGPLYATQQRHLRRSAELLGLAGSQRLAGEVAELLDLDGLEHSRARALYRSASGLRQRGEAVVSVLLALAPARSEHLVAAGHRVGLWGRPWRIDPRTGRRRPPSGSRPPPMNFALSSPAGAA
jgi:hypothetical protein